ncbi:hypothetical protein GCM10022286_30440 [Gryllotalpicola daejeonensis]|uniref:Polysaccharide pyruvyl transferase domain-containing protein n=1 Tax=Gryllotalpicola daejeonensis TaxID=993087 RepID=A0ABP7ZNL0_9MICO
MTLDGAVTGTMPGLEGLERLLDGYRGASAYLIPMTAADGRTMLGNNGDRIMHAVFHRILERLDIRAVAAPAAADVVIVPPNGALLEVYGFPELLAERLRGAEGVPLVIFPSSTLFPTRDPAFMFRGRSAETLWITREKYSFDHLDEQWGLSLADVGVTLALDHDVVASGHEFVPELLGGAGSGGGLLVAGRRDKEAADLRSAGSGSTHGARASGQASARLLARLKKAVPYGPWYTAAVRRARRAQLAAAADRLLGRLPAETRAELEHAGRRRDVDLSAVQYATYDEYRRVLRNADAVVTDRLHVGLPAAILGKRVVLVEAGYHKLQGVYERSLAELPNVELVGAR